MRWRPLVLAATIAIAGVMDVPCDAAPLASASRSAVAFGRIPQGAPSPVQPVFVTNLGDDALVVSGFDLAGEDAADFQLAASSTCGAPATLGPGQRCRVDFVALPHWTQTREISATLTVESNAGGAEIRLTATADALLVTPIVTSAPGFVDFAAQAAGAPSAPLSLVIGNATTAPLALGRPALLGGDATDFVATSDCLLEHTLAPDRTCTISVTFSPRAAGPRSTEIAIEAGYGNERVFYRWSVTGTGSE